MRQGACRDDRAPVGAAHAWRTAVRAEAERLRASPSAFLAERAADLVDMERQVVAAIVGGEDALPTPPPGAVVVADELLPSQVPPLVRAGAAGFCTARGGPTSHAAILAASAGVPARRVTKAPKQERASA